MSWKLASAGREVAVDLNAGDDGALMGTITYTGRVFAVAGSWAASGSIPGRNASAFSFAGRTSGVPDVPSFVSASGIMAGPGNAPQSINIQLDVTSSADGTFEQYVGVLLPA
jgi:hypothetical protein